MLTTSRRRVVSGAAVAAIACAAGYAYYQQTASRKSATRPAKKKGQDAIVTKKQVKVYFRALIAKLYKAGGTKLLLIAGLTLIRTALQNYQGKLQGNLFKTAFLKEVPEFTRLLIRNVGLCIVTSTVESSMRLLIARTEIQWRTLITERLHRKYFSDMAYYQMSYVDRRIENPEQHICEDAAKVATDLAGVTGEMAQSVVDAVFYSVRLWQYNGTNLYTGAMAAYIFCAGALTTAIAPNFSRLVRKTQELEGAYTQAHERLRSDVEPITLLGGLKHEASTAQNAFTSLVSHTKRVLSAQLYSGITTDFFLKYLSAVAAVLMIIGPFFGTAQAKMARSTQGRAEMLSNMRYHTSVILSMFYALGTLATTPRKWQKLTGYVQRLASMEKVLNDVRETARQLEVVPNSNGGGLSSPRGSLEHVPVAPSSGELAASDIPRIGSRIASDTDEISFEHVTVVTPAGSVLVRDLTLRVPAGTNLLVTGPNGVGKSSLFRALGGLWPITKGVIRKPGHASEAGLSHHIFYVPQRPYVMSGTLIEQIIYPVTVSNQAQELSVTDLESILAEVDLTNLLTRYGADEVVQWPEVLSLGEQQRLGIARLLYHKPRYAILDECTSGVTTDMEKRFTQILERLGCTCITISHRPTLVAHHDLVLALDGDGKWRLLARQRKRLPGNAESQAPVEFRELSGGLGAEGPRSGGGGDGASSTRSADAATVNAAMSAVTRPGASEEGNVTRRVLAQVVSEPGTTVSAAASQAYSSRFMRERLAPLRAAPPAAGYAQWRAVLDVVFARVPKATLLRQIGGIGAIVLARTLLQDRIARLNGRTVEFMLQQNRGRFQTLIYISLVQALGSAILAPALRYATDTLALTWRKQLTEAVSQSYLRDNTAYAVAQLAGMSDADQRITRDVQSLSKELSNLVPTLVKPLFDIVWFSWQMAQLSGAHGVAMLYGYMGAGFLSLRVLSPNFAALAARTLDLESRFRKAHHYVKQHAESVAFFGGAAREGSAIAGCFDTLISQLHKLARAHWLHAIVDDLFTKQLPHNATWALTLLYALRRDASGWADVAAQGATVFDMRYLATVVANCFLAFGEILQMHTRLYELTGGISRVSTLLATSAAAQELQRDISDMNLTPGRPDEPLVQLEGLTVVTPSGRALVKHCSLRIERGANLLVTGPNGSGKSSLFRIMRGLWPNVRGRIVVAGGLERWQSCRHIVYVPQQPYLSFGSLLEQIIYPLTVDEALETHAGHPKGKLVGKSDAMKQLSAKCDSLMDVVRLAYLVEREGGWLTRKAWGTVLSLGEQQRMRMASLFFHRPEVAVLDECTNATSVDVEQKLYEYAEELGITIITVTQRPALVKLHKHELKLLDGEGHWQLCELEHK